MNKLSPSIKKIAAVTGLLVGSFAFAVLAAGVWTEAPQNPPFGNTDAPLNVGSEPQHKLGTLAINSSKNADGRVLDVNGSALFFSDVGVNGLLNPINLQVDGYLRLISGDKDQPGYVLTNDGTGKAEWKPVGDANSVSKWVKIDRPDAEKIYASGGLMTWVAYKFSTYPERNTYPLDLMCKKAGYTNATGACRDAGTGLYLNNETHLEGSNMISTVNGRFNAGLQRWEYSCWFGDGAGYADSNTEILCIK